MCLEFSEDFSKYKGGDYIFLLAIENRGYVVKIDKFERGIPVSYQLNHQFFDKFTGKSIF